MLLLIMAWRNIWRNRVRSLVIMVSVAMGLVAGLFVMGLYAGMLNDRMRTVIDKEVAHIQMHHPKFEDDHEAVFTMPDLDKTDSILLHHPLIQATAARSIALGMLATAEGSSGVQLMGVEYEEECRVSKLQNKIKEGSFGSAEKKHQLLVGKKLADKMKLKLGSKVVLTFTDKSGSIISASFRVSGVYQSENSRLDEVNVYVKKAELDPLLGLSNECHEWAILLKRDDETDSMKQVISGIYPSSKVESWKDISVETRLLIATTDQYSIIFVFIIMLALAFGIINTMLMAVLERTHEIGMLVALGMNKARLFLLVLWETVMLTFAGVPAGFGMGWLLLRYLETHGLDYSSAGEAMAGFGFGNIIYPVFPWGQLLMVVYVVVITALLASIFPSYQALRLKPVDAMRH
ncbi:MAG: ABC transporter permease [Bacteroidetes bacterium]|nr:ABC transporter permease [Bacteroidota bacterium]